MPIYQQGSARLGAGAAARLGAGAAANPANAGQAVPANAAPSSTTALGGLTAGAGAGQRATGNVQRTSRGLGRRAQDASRNFYSTDDRYARNVGDPNAVTQAEDYKVYSNDPSQVDQAPIPLSQAPAQYVPPAAAPAMQPVAPDVTVAPPPAAVPPPPRPVINLDSTNPGTVRAEAGTTAPTSPVAGVRSDLTSGNLSGRLDQPAPAPQGLTGPSLVNSVRTDAASGNLSATLPQPAPTQILQQSNPDVAGFLAAQKRNLILGR